MKAVLTLPEGPVEVIPRSGDALSGNARQAGRDTRPHILFIIDQICGLGGAENVLLNMIRFLRAEGFRCSVATFKIEPGLGIFEEFPCPLHLFPLRHTYSWNALRMAARLWRLIRSERVAIVHTFFPTSNLWGAMVARLSGCPVVVSSRRDMGILRTWKHRLAYPLINHWVDQVVAVSNAVRNFCIRDERLTPDKVLTLYNGVDLEKIAAAERTQAVRASLGLEKASHLIVTVANIRQVKGIDVLVRAAQIVHREFPDAVFAVVGSGAQKEKNYLRHVQELIRSAGLTEHLKLIGPSNNVFPVLKASDIFCLLSRSEGFSNALLEAMACGLPCVATRVGGNAEAIEEGRSGFLVEDEDAKAAAERILRLLRDPERSRKMGAAGRQIVESRFTVEVMVQNLVHMYDHLLERKESGVSADGRVGRPWLAQVSACNGSGRVPSDLKRRMRTALKWGWVVFLYSTGMLRWAKRRLAARGGVVVLTFHRVLPDSQYATTYSTVGMIVRQQTFEEMAGYVARHCQVVSLAGDPTKHQGGLQRPRLAFSFDDGWDDNARVAAPIARKHGIPLAIFVCPARVGASFPFWPERVAALCDAAERSGATDQVGALLASRIASGTEILRQRNHGTLAEKTIELLKTLSGDLRERVVEELSRSLGGHPQTAPQAALHRTLTWEEVRELAGDGVTFGSHSLTHQILPQIPLPAVQHELEASKRLLEQHLGGECRTFTYPNGSWTREVRDLVAQAGYTRAFRNDPGAWTSDSDPLLIPRVNISEGSITGPSERFSPLVFEYAVFWRSFRSRTEASNGSGG